MKVLFLCTGNSCRSQIAEGWARRLGGDAVDALSAGIEAHGKNPRAIAVMAEAGVDISGQESTRLTDAMLADADYLVTVCGHADEHCPAAARTRSWPFFAPAVTTSARASRTCSRASRRTTHERDRRSPLKHERIRTPPFALGGAVHGHGPRLGLPVEGQ